MSIQIKLSKKELHYLDVQKLLLHKGKKNTEIEDFLAVDRITIWRTIYNQYFNGQKGTNCF